MRLTVMAALAASLAASPVHAQESVALASAVFVERIAHTGDGRVERRIEPATTLTRGDKVVLMVEWRASGSGSGKDKGFTVTSPVPSTLAFQEASLDGAEVSADGGRSWGRLGELQIRDAGGLRLVAPEDVNRLRWRVSGAQAAKASGRVTYSAIVR